MEKMMHQGEEDRAVGADGLERQFLGWDRPGLQSAAEFFLERYGGQEGNLAGVLDLSSAVAVVPGARAGRRLLECLVDLCREAGRTLTPPRILTAAALATEIVQPRLPIAGSLLRRLLWMRALVNAPRESLERLCPRLPEKNDVRGWLALADIVAGVCRELAGEGLEPGRVSTDAASLEDFPDHERWQALTTLHDAYLRELEQQGYEDPEEARLTAAGEGRCSYDRDIVLVATPDLSRSIRQLLNGLSRPIIALVFAPQALAERFDAYGCLVPEAWTRARIDLDFERVLVADRPDAQARAVVGALARHEGRYAAEDIVIGVPDATFLPYIERELARHGAPTHRGAGFPIDSSAPGKFLHALEAYLAGRRFRELGALVRQPDVESWLLRGDLPARAAPETWLPELDRFATKHLPDRIPEGGLGEAAAQGTALAVFDCFEPLVEKFFGPPRPLNEWAQPITDCLLEIYAVKTLPAPTAHSSGPSPHQGPSEATRACLEQIQRVLVELQDLEGVAVPEVVVPEVAALDALHLVRGLLARTTVPGPVREGAIELLGWLELPLDDAPALVLTGLNEGLVPAVVRSDPFLPDSLRRSLGLTDNRLRYARDAYALSAIAASRESLDAVVGLRAVDGDPLEPSRLLFACDDAALPKRVERLFPEGPPPEATNPEATNPEPEEHPEHGTTKEPSQAARTENRAGNSGSANGSPRGFVAHPPQPLKQPLSTLSATAFRDYLTCPYGFYLRHVLRLRVLDDSAEELDPLSFGTLAHDVLRTFGSGPLATSTDAAAIVRGLDTALKKLARANFGKSPRPAVRVQLEQLRSRLHRFAQWQAHRAEEGWRIAQTEIGVDEPNFAAVVEGTEVTMYLKGRIDRVDIHAETGEVVIFDYKTSEDGASPEKTHRKGDAWIDLQLPLYRKLAPALGLPANAKVGYILLPKKLDDIGHRIAAWTDGDFAAAMEQARWVVDQVQDEVFWPPTSEGRKRFREYAWIYQQEVAEAVARVEDKAR